MNVDLRKLFSQPMEPQTRCYAYGHGIDMGQSFPNSFECKAAPNIYVLFQESADDVSHAKYIHWLWPWFLPEPWPTTQIFLATSCHPNSKPLFPLLSTTPAKATFLGNLTFYRLDKIVERSHLSRSMLTSYADEISFKHTKVLGQA
jgi:hypothetical protein